MDKELELAKALTFLSNNWRHDPELRQAFADVFVVLEAGSQKDLVNAEILRHYLSYPGSIDAQDATMSLHASLRTTEGRKAAGLSPRRKGRSYSSSMVTINDAVFQVMINYELGLATKSHVEDAVSDYIGLNAAPATRKTFINELRPKAVAHAEFIRKFNDAANKKSPL